MAQHVHNPFADPHVRANHHAARREHSSETLAWQHVDASVWHEVAEAPDFEMPTARSHRLVLVTGGRYRIESRRGSRWRQALYGPGSLGLTRANEPTTLRWRSVTPARLTSLHICLDPELVHDAARALTRARSHDFPDALTLDDPAVVSAVRDIGWALHAGAPAIYADSAAHVLAARLVTAALPSADRRETAGLNAAVLNRIVEYMDAHVGDPVTLDDLSAVANLSKHYLLRRFKVSTGMPPHRYLQRMRMQNAELLLATSDLTVTSIARRCSYASDRQFAVAFTRHCGLTPARFRAVRRQA